MSLKRNNRRLVVSIIIPIYNRYEELKKLLHSIYTHCKESNYETIVVDDYSEVDFQKLKEVYGIKLIRLKKNSGPSVARNIGASNATGDLLLFLDSDVVVDFDVVSYCEKKHLENPQLVSIFGIYKKESINKGFIPEYKALFDHYVFLGKDGEFTAIFNTASGTIKKEVFKEFAGFAEDYKNADVEDIEFGYRIVKKYPQGIQYDLGFQVYHHFPYLNTLLKNYYRRTYEWILLLKKRKKMDSVCTSSNEMVKRFLSTCNVLAIIAAAGSHKWYLILFSILPWLAAMSDFMGYLLKERGCWFLLKSVAVYHLESLVISIAGMHSLFTLISNKMKVCLRMG
jgi:glycosyltransferase involved in cell wall biosynthesis|tara:strand:+ start:122 stop:1141 length:1020 start_codon:yes stop_codon:yes gene_type:complete